MSKIKFCSKEHEEFFYAMLLKCGNMDVYHMAFFYTVGLTAKTRIHVQQLFSLNDDCIIPEGLHHGWQTGGTSRVTRLAFNLWNGFMEEGCEELFTPYGMFDCEFTLYFFEAVKLRYPEYCWMYQEETQEAVAAR